MVDVALSEHKLPQKLSRLEAFKDRLTIVQSLSGEGFSGNHTAGYGALSCHNSEQVAVAPTIDCLLGQHLSTGPYPIYGPVPSRHPRVRRFSSFSEPRWLLRNNSSGNWL